ncbi:MAG TPA: hypothetical protein DIS79_04675 [Bacteroidetes bacterium]|nr:hypothetical protein [Bacteroidota bacterium]HRK04444.1 hypothetical protein [Chlorobiota bacterium]
MVAFECLNELVWRSGLLLNGKRRISKLYVELINVSPETPYIEDGNYSTAVCGANTVNAPEDVPLGKDNTVTMLGREEVKILNLTDSTLKLHPYINEMTSAMMYAVEYQRIR